jgi:hypothetical protein
MKKITLLLIVSVCVLSCTKESAAHLDPNGSKNNNSTSIESLPTMDPNGKNTSNIQSSNGDAGVAGDPFGK